MISLLTKTQNLIYLRQNTQRRLYCNSSLFSTSFIFSKQIFTRGSHHFSEQQYIYISLNNPQPHVQLMIFQVKTNNYGIVWGGNCVTPPSGLLHKIAVFASWVYMLHNWSLIFLSVDKRAFHFSTRTFWSYWIVYLMGFVCWAAPVSTPDLKQSSDMTVEIMAVGEVAKMLKLIPLSSVSFL